MQDLDIQTQHALAKRAALKRLLAWELTDDEAHDLLGAILFDGYTPGQRLDAWRAISGTHAELVRLRGGGDPGFEDEGDGVYRTADPDLLATRLEEELKAALDCAAGIIPPIARKVA